MDIPADIARFIEGPVMMTLATRDARNRAMIARGHRLNGVTIDDEDTITGRRPVPDPVDQPTADCNAQQKKEVAHAQPIAVDMVRNALFELRDRDSAKVKRLLRKYFNTDDAKAFEALRCDRVRDAHADI